MSTESQESRSNETHASTSESALGSGARVAAATVGAALLALGLRRRSLVGAATALAGGWLLYRGLGGRGRERPLSGALAGGTEVERSVTVGESADELHRIWRDPEQLARVVGAFADVTPAGEERQHWVVRGPLGRSVSWDTRVVEERPGEYLRWESVDGATASVEGSVRFRPAPSDRGTEVTLRLRLDPPGGALGDAASGLLGVVPEAVAGQLLDRFKSLAETGEIQTLERNPSARGSGDWV